MVYTCIHVVDYRPYLDLTAGDQLSSTVNQ